MVNLVDPSKYYQAMQPSPVTSALETQFTQAPAQTLSALIASRMRDETQRKQLRDYIGQVNEQALGNEEASRAAALNEARLSFLGSSSAQKRLGSFIQPLQQVGLMSNDPNEQLLQAMADESTQTARDAENVETASKGAKNFVEAGFVPTNPQINHPLSVLNMLQQFAPEAAPKQVKEKIKQSGGIQQAQIRAAGARDVANIRNEIGLKNIDKVVDTNSEVDINSPEVSHNTTFADYPELAAKGSMKDADGSTVIETESGMLIVYQPDGKILLKDKQGVVLGDLTDGEPD